MAETERRLAAIMFTDMMGYSAMAHEDEALALQLLNENRQTLESLFGRHKGRVVKTIGDAFLVEFGSVLDAVKCAIEIQTSMHRRNETIEAGKKVGLRIGIHLGDVIHQDGDILGDGVNIAARIETLSEAGGVCISRQVYDQVYNKLGIKFIHVGERMLKNITSPVDVYRLDFRTKEVEKIQDVHRIAVLPLTNMTSDPNDEYFADGMTDELISALAKVKGLTVISRTSVMKYKGANAQIGEISRELNVGTVVEGSVRKSGNKIRITAQLIDATTDGHLWSQAYNRELTDIFEIQSDIAQQVAEALRVQLLSSERKGIEKRATESTDAYKLFLKGRYYWNERTREGIDKAVSYFEEAVKRDTAFALGYAGLADCYVVYSNYGWQTTIEALPKAKDYALKSIQMDSTLAEPHASLGTTLALYDHKWQQAEDELRRAIELKPSYATAYHWYSLLLRFIGRYDESYEQIKRASELDPLSRIIGANVVETLYVIGKVKEAIEVCGRVIEANPDYPFAHFQRGWAYYLDSRIDEAIDELQKSVDLSRFDPLYKAELACLLGFTGRRDAANKINDELIELSKTSFVDKTEIAFALFGAGRTDEGFSYLEKSFEERSDIILDFTFRPWFSEARRDPRWASIKKRLALPGK